MASGVDQGSNHEIVELGLQDTNSDEKSPARYVAY